MQKQNINFKICASLHIISSQVLNHTTLSILPISSASVKATQPDTEVDSKTYTLTQKFNSLLWKLKVDQKVINKLPLINT